MYMQFSPPTGCPLKVPQLADGPYKGIAATGIVRRGQTVEVGLPGEPHCV